MHGAILRTEAAYYSLVLLAVLLSPTSCFDPKFKCRCQDQYNYKNNKFTCTTEFGDSIHKHCGAQKYCISDSFYYGDWATGCAWCTCPLPNDPKENWMVCYTEHGTVIKHWCNPWEVCSNERDIHPGEWGSGCKSVLLNPLVRGGKRREFSGP